VCEIVGLFLAANDRTELVRFPSQRRRRALMGGCRTMDYIEETSAGLLVDAPVQRVLQMISVYRRCIDLGSEASTHLVLSDRHQTWRNGCRHLQFLIVDVDSITSNDYLEYPDRRIASTGQ
jgi:hypothetical protein